MTLLTKYIAVWFKTNTKKLSIVFCKGLTLKIYIQNNYLLYTA